jgi:hypothetical protein
MLQVLTKMRLAIQPVAIDTGTIANQVIVSTACARRSTVALRSAVIALLVDGESVHAFEEAVCDANEDGEDDAESRRHRSPGLIGGARGGGAKLGGVEVVGRGLAGDARVQALAVERVADAAESLA